MNEEPLGANPTLFSRRLGDGCVSFLVLIPITLLTPPESEETLKRFFARCRPPGFWGPIRRQIQIAATGEPSSGRMFFDSMLGILAAFGLVLATNAVFVGDWPTFSVGLIACIMAGGWLLKRIMDTRPAPQSVPSLSSFETAKNK